MILPTVRGPLSHTREIPQHYTSSRKFQGHCRLCVAVLQSRDHSLTLASLILVSSARGWESKTKRDQQQTNVHDCHQNALALLWRPSPYLKNTTRQIKNNLRNQMFPLSHAPSELLVPLMEPRSFVNKVSFEVATSVWNSADDHYTLLRKFQRHCRMCLCHCAIISRLFLTVAKVSSWSNQLHNKEK